MAAAATIKPNVLNNTWFSLGSGTGTVQNFSAGGVMQFLQTDGTPGTSSPHHLWFGQEPLNYSTAIGMTTYIRVNADQPDVIWTQVT